MNGPQVTARPGTKRHLKQLRARAVFNAVYLSHAKAQARRAQAEYEAAQAETAEIQARIDLVTTLILAVSPAGGNA